MSDLSQSFPTIEDGVYDSDLKQILWSLRYTHSEEKDLYDLLLKLMEADLQYFQEGTLRADLTESEINKLLDTTPYPGIANKELLARWSDAVITLDKKRIKENINTAQGSYTAVFVSTKKTKYLLRATTLVKFAKGMFKEQLELIFEVVKSAVEASDSAFWQQKLLVEVVAVFGVERCQQEFATLLDKHISRFLELADYQSARFALESLNVIGAIDGNTCNIRLAESYEMQGDGYVAEKRPNTYYPNISETYQKGLYKIASTHDCEELQSRLERKIAEAQLEDFQMIQVAGSPVFPKIDIDEIHQSVLKFSIKDMGDAYHTLMSLPVPSKVSVERDAKSSIEAELPLSRFFSGTVKKNRKGAHVAKQTTDENHFNNSRLYLRERLMAFIHMLKNKLDSYGEINEAMVEQLLHESKSPMLAGDRVYMYTLAISAGFKNNFIIAAHLLLPQLEYSLRYLGTQNGITMTTYDKDLHLENTMGGTLEKLRPLANEDIIDELISFLTDKNNVNFRNDLLHGEMETILVHKYGMYIWWLSLKLILQTKSMFPHIKTK